MCGMGSIWEAAADTIFTFFDDIEQAKHARQYFGNPTFNVAVNTLAPAHCLRLGLSHSL